jgi:hypothetical protein
VEETADLPAFTATQQGIDLQFLGQLAQVDVYRKSDAAQTDMLKYIKMTTTTTRDNGASIWTSFKNQTPKFCR